MSPDVDRHPFKKNGSEEKTGVRGVSTGRQEPQHLVHELRRSLVSKWRKLQQQFGLLVIRLRINLQKVGLQVVVGHGARFGNQTVGNPHGDLLSQGLHQVGVLRHLSTHGLDHKFLLSS